MPSVVYFELAEPTQFRGELSWSGAEIQCSSLRTCSRTVAWARRGRMNGLIQELHTGISPQALSFTSLVKPSPGSLRSTCLI